MREWNGVESNEWKNNAHHLQRDVTVRIVIVGLKGTLSFFGSACFKLDPQGWRRGGGGQGNGEETEIERDLK